VAVKFSQMVQVVEMSHQEKIEMYRMIDKERLIEMLIEANNVISRLTPKVVYGTSNIYCHCHQSQVYQINGTNICCICNKPLSA
jgi:hypothetical protein